MQKNQLKSLFFGGLLPVIAFTVIEEWQGPVWGTIAGLVFGAGEIIYEWRTQGKVSLITWTSNAFVFALGIVSIYTQEGVWFKLQPAFLIFIFALWLLATSFKGEPLLLSLARKQNPDIPPPLLEFFKKINLRVGFLCLGITALSVHAALYWPTPAWAFLKGIGMPLILGAYCLIEVLIFRMRLKSKG